ncbi:hypothetical protein OIU34_21535 [Pararhizobium sp. BT-229]|uniref:hypothetical protein n=1 Tax=Pararhizobium sp. BT-229 TaxID=2986923 RepID=UPI0021F72890|nr:hypothetical protein [Pararhizobium sp. BT-229]MCV9964476.1 hypothetical protein [Pararhizobium sp. BT-229]
MRAVSACLQSLFLTTDGFSRAEPADFDCGRQNALLLAGKGLSCLGSSDLNTSAWNLSKEPFQHAAAAGAVVAAKLREQAAAIIAFVLEATSSLTKVSPEWIMEHPFSLPVFVNATGTSSKKKFKKEVKLTNASDRKIGATDASRIVASLKPDDVLTEREIVAGMEALIEGIVRDQIGKVVNEDFVKRALDELELPYVRDEGGTALIEGEYSASRADFAIPSNVGPRAFIEVRKSGSNHASVYANDLCMTVVDRITRHPKCLAVLLYDGSWSGPSREKVDRVFDYVFHVHESRGAADIIKRHLAGEEMRKTGRLYLTSAEPPGRP